jgi:hypothetical protein
LAAQMNRSGFVRIVIGLALFGISFGYVEAAVVVYLRTIYDPIREQISPARSPGDLFPLIRLEQLQAAGPHHMHRLKTELGRELATLVLLGGAALLAARNFREWMAAFVVSFGIWDICFYLFLRLLIDWPTSLLTWDILFLLPLPWVGPVISPTLIAAVMIITGSLVLWRERHDRPVEFTHGHWAALVAGGIVLVVSFCWDYRNIMAGGYPQPFNWPLYGAGLLLAIVAFTHAFLRKGERDRNSANG